MPTTALLIIAVLTAVCAACNAAFSVAFAAEIDAARTKLTSYAPLAILAALLGVASLALWWYVALTSGVLLLGVIPTVAAVSTAVSKGLVRLCRP